MPNANRRPCTVNPEYAVSRNSVDLTIDEETISSYDAPLLSRSIRIYDFYTGIFLLKEEILKCSRGELFGPGNANFLPNMLMIDRIININNTGGSHGLGEIIAEIDITPDLGLIVTSR